MDPVASIGRISSRLFPDRASQRRRRAERAERAWSAREALRDVRRSIWVFPGRGPAFNGA
jgi:hypothetical protein